MKFMKISTLGVRLRRLRGIFLLKQTNTSQVKCHELKTARNQERKRAGGVKSNECTSKLIFVVNCTNREKNKQVRGSSKGVQEQEGRGAKQGPQASDHKFSKLKTSVQEHSKPKRGRCTCTNAQEK